MLADSQVKAQPFGISIFGDVSEAKSNRVTWPVHWKNPVGETSLSGNFLICAEDRPSKLGLSGADEAGDSQDFVLMDGEIDRGLEMFRLQAVDRKKHLSFLRSLQASSGYSGRSDHQTNNVLQIRCFGFQGREVDPIPENCDAIPDDLDLFQFVRDVNDSETAIFQLGN